MWHYWRIVTKHFMEMLLQISSVSWEYTLLFIWCSLIVLNILIWSVAQGSMCTTLDLNRRVFGVWRMLAQMQVPAFSTQTGYTDLFWCMDTNANIQMCKFPRAANPGKHGVSDSARLSQLQVIHKPCVRSQWGTGASSASSPCQIAVLGAVENLPDIGLHCHTYSQHCHTLGHYLRITSTAQLSQGDRPSSISIHVRENWLQLRYFDVSCWRQPRWMLFLKFL